MKRGGKILGYDSCPCSIFLNLKNQVGTSAYRDLKVEDDWTLKCPKICICREGLLREMGLQMPPKEDVPPSSSSLFFVEQMLSSFFEELRILIVAWPEKEVLTLCNAYEACDA